MPSDRRRELSYVHTASIPTVFLIFLSEPAVAHTAIIDSSAAHGPHVPQILAHTVRVNSSLFCAAYPRSGTRSIAGPALAPSCVLPVSIACTPSHPRDEASSRSSTPRAHNTCARRATQYLTSVPSAHQRLAKHPRPSASTPLAWSVHPICVLPFSLPRSHI